MANHKSSLKRAQQSETRRMRNKDVKTRVKGVVKEIRLAADENKTDVAKERLNVAKSVIAKAGKKGVLHKKTASRKISRLSKLVNTLAE